MRERRCRCPQCGAEKVLREEGEELRYVTRDKYGREKIWHVCPVCGKTSEILKGFLF